MADKPKLYYFNGRGLAESIRWLLATAGVEFEEVFLETREQFLKLIEDGVLLFKQVPLLEIDGMKIVQRRAILNYLATKYSLYGNDVKERTLIDMYMEGAYDLMDPCIMYTFLSPAAKEKQKELIVQEATTRYFPVYERILKDHGQNFLVGNQLSCADLQVLEIILMVEEKEANVLSNFPTLQAFKSRISSIPPIAKFLQPGSQRKPLPDDKYVETVTTVLQKTYS